MNEEYRIGHGYDLHRLEPVAPDGPGRPFLLAGCHFDHDHGPISHSDGDAAFHAIADALLGAIGAPDIGQLFPDTDPQWKGLDSKVVLEQAEALVRQGGMRIVNMDVTVVCERPKIAPRKAELIGNIASCLSIDPSRINLKAKTHESVDAIGAGKAIEVHTVVLLAPA